MSVRTSRQLVCGLLGILTVAACTGIPAAPHRVVSPSQTGPHVSSPRAPGTPAAPPPRRVTRADAARCPRTTFSHVVALPGQSPADLGPGTTMYGNGKLFTTLNLDGMLVAPADYVNPDGSISWKFPWWRYVSGHITITGRRLDAPAGPLTSYVPAGYGDIGFQATGVTFPSEGCWQVTARIDHTSVTFVTFVIKAA